MYWAQIDGMHLPLHGEWKMPMEGLENKRKTELATAKVNHQSYMPMHQDSRSLAFITERETKPKASIVGLNMDPPIAALPHHQAIRPQECMDVDWDYGCSPGLVDCAAPPLTWR
jgi:hypothetical protein